MRSKAFVHDQERYLSPHGEEALRAVSNP